MRDQELLADAAKAKFEIRPVSGPTIQALVNEIYQTPVEIVRKTMDLLQ
jgi:hypothetical protein